MAGEENDEVEEQMGVLAFPTENPNQRKIAQPADVLLVLSHHASNCGQRKRTRKQETLLSRSKCPWWTANFVRLDYFLLL